MGAEEAIAFGAGPGVGFAGDPGLAGVGGFGVDEVAVEHQFGAAVV